jgi:lipid-A-disaccharide synthase
MTLSEIEAFRSWIYCFGFLSSLAFALRFVIQWLASERAGVGVVPKVFWYLSGTGNFLLMVHSFFQLHFFLYLLQSLHIVLSWRNLNLSTKSPKSFRTVVLFLFLAGVLATCVYASQLVFLPTGAFTWIRAPGSSQSSGSSSLWLHLMGCVGISAFSLRFWLQWWEAETKGRSVLSSHFWWLSLFGACVSILYFFECADWVNIVGPVCSIIPYVRNLMLTRTPNGSCNVAILAGEVSGDLLGASISTAIRAQFPQLHICGIAGPSMRSSGVSPWLKSEKFQVMGLSDVLKKALFLIFAIRATVTRILATNPAVVFTIDQPSFSFAVAKRLRKKGFTGKLVQVVAPTVWAYKPQRADIVASYYNHILPLFSFEEQFFSKKLPTTWTGHPLLDSIKPYLASSIPKSVLAIFPGSRPGEIRKNISLQLSAAAILLSQYPDLQPAIVISETLSDSMKKDIKGESQKILGEKVSLVDFHDRYQLMQRTKAAITKSGTVTLELGLFAIPFVCCYNLSFLTKFWALHVVKLKLRHFSLPNIILQQQIFPECIFPPVTPQLIAEALSPFLSGTKSLPENISTLLLQQITSKHQLSTVVGNIVTEALKIQGVGLELESGRNNGT